MKFTDQIKQTSNSKSYRAYTFISMIYITIILIADVVIYKIVRIGSLTFTVGSLVTPFWFVITDIVAEVYGYRLAKKLIWSGLFCGFLFAIVCYFLIQFPSPSSWSLQPAYDQVLGGLPRIFIGSVTGVMIGAFVNTYLITKWKILTQGKYFWLRSIGSSIVGQFVFTVITISYDLLGIILLPNIAKLIFVSIIIKLLVTPILAIFSTVVVYYLKKLEGIDVYDYHTNFNPFKLGVL